MSKNIRKKQTTTTLTNSGETLLYVEATNVWGTTFHQIITVQPYATPKWEIPFNKTTIYLTAIITLTIITSFITYFIKTK
ncbi:MAG: hypothetical protein LBQ98_05615 [Nitrososphaerota archaeon]|jgi:hypothetical protein|nr:hypothetical protein [Nitrososphaerota archaeon]